MTRLKITAVTGSRADFGIMRWLLQDIANDADLELTLIVTGTHLEVAHGNTVDEIVASGLPIAARVPIALTDDSPRGIAQSMALALTGIANALATLRSDLVLLLGDRFEIMAAAEAAMLCRIPIAHIAGGDVSEGAIDDVIRHAITKMAHLHFVTNKESAARVRQMGEEDARIFVTGSPALDHLRRSPLVPRDELEVLLDARLGQRNILATFHPETLADDFGLTQLDEMLAAIDAVYAVGDAIWFTKSNADSGGVEINRRVEQWSADRDWVRVYPSLGHTNYVALLGLADVVLGNSSSGLYEAPAVGTATVNIGGRQGGRLTANSVFNAAPERTAIVDAISQALAFDRASARSPYGDGHASEKIITAIKAAPPRAELLHKRFTPLCVSGSL
ncbi:UDP-N-acetylglucosamine 2-epimerase [Altererythrobacter rubellus]|uniref:UDP-N-acetylglucosamine 2-epimerase n=1 Tax=Altererythrobacter rubellus TaxID=2173831 RepID=A0A9Y2F581_9SPHN|nr:UDP-N-acetylglucosamine 2-epimerase [Altererythrobacter rubellus]WIW95933.1 UDP-N-acetylglucosamine 2-epimerase [Altererythrobacter rubellus]